jgi:GTPase Era involved in 16S rRNA processing
MLKLIGARARREIAVMRGGKVYLESYVKVEEGWRNDIQQVTSIA